MKCFPILATTLLLASCIALPSAEVAPVALRMPLMVVQPTTEGPVEEAVLPAPADNTLVRGISVGEVVIGRETNNTLPVEAEPINEAILNTLATHGLLKMNRPRYRLNTTLANLDLPLVINPLNFWVQARMTYELIEVATGSIAWTADLSTSGELDGLVTDRTNAARDASEKAIQANIRDMLTRLYQKPQTVQQIEPPLAPVPVPVPHPVPSGIPPVDVPLETGRPRT